MLRIRILSFLAALLLVCTGALTAAAAQTDCDSIYCFSVEDFSGGEALRGICVTGLPAPEAGTVLLGARVLGAGAVLTADQLSELTFSPLKTEEDVQAEMTYLPVYENAVGAESVMTISIRGKEDKAPVAEDSAMETYKNLPLNGKLKVSDPEEQCMTYTVTRQPKRGSVLIREDGSFTYTPKKNKIGVDSFAYTATDPAGKVSREATVIITILKPTDGKQYADTTGRECGFAAEWMRHSGIFTGETLAGKPCFGPDKQVTRGEFVTMLVKALEIPTEKDVTLTGYTDEIPTWLQPYLAAAVRSGLVEGLPEQQVFGAGEAITGAEAAVILRNALNVAAPEGAQTMAEEAVCPVWAEAAVAALGCSGMELEPEAVLTRADAALLLYQAARLDGGGC